MSDAPSRPGEETVDADLTAPLPARPRTHADPEQIGPYRIIERVGEGGMGLVYKAEQREPVRRLVALKVIRAGMDTEDVVARFEAERQAVALMNHPNVARVYEAGVTDQGRPYFAMEFVPGVPLNAYCDDNRLPTRRRLEMFVQVCQAVQHAHQKGIIHRDLKPSNVLVTLVDGQPVPKVIDFGIAKATNQRLTQKTLFTQTGALIGTPEYMSPEQAQTSGLDVDTRTDVYSLGVILFELLTGTLPFDAKALRSGGLDDMARMIRETEPPKPSTRISRASQSAHAAASQPAAAAPSRIRIDRKALRREVEGDLDWIVLKAMEKDRTRRYDSAEALAADVRRHLENELVLARPPSTAYRLSKFVRKHRVGVAAVAAIAVALVAGLGAATYGMVQARRQSRLAEDARRAADGARVAAERARDQVNDANVFLRDLFMSFGNAPGARQRLEAVVSKMDGGWLKDQVPTAVACRIAVGYFYMRERNYPVAQRQFDEALRLVGNSPDAAPALSAIHTALFEVAEARDDTAGAQSHLRAALDAQRTLGDSETSATTLATMAGRIESADPAAAKRLRLEALDILIAARTRDLATQPGDSEKYLARGTLHCRAGHFVDARADLEKAVELDPNNHWAWYRLACLRLYLGDDPGYRSAAQQMLQRFGSDPRRDLVERTAKVTLLAPSPAGNAAQVSAMVERSLAPGAARSLVPWLAMCKALAEYRAGRFDAAAEWAEKARAVDSFAGQATLDLLTAMAHQKAGRSEEARRWLRQAQERIRTQVPQPGVDDLVASENYLVCEIIRREAEALVEGKPSGG